MLGCSLDKVRCTRALLYFPLTILWLISLSSLVCSVAESSWYFFKVFDCISTSLISAFSGSLFLENFILNFYMYIGWSNISCILPKIKLVVLPVLAVYCSLFSCVLCSYPSPRPSVVNIGAVLSFNSTIGRVAKVAIDAAVEDINSDLSVLPGTTLAVHMHDTNRSGFLGIVEALQFVGTDTMAIIGPQSSMLAHVIAQIANELHIPLLSFSATDPTLNSLQYPFFVQTTQSDVFQMAAVAAVVDYYQWREVIAIFIDDAYGRNGVAALGEALAGRRWKILYKAAFRPGATRNDIMELLNKVVLMASRVIVLHANLDSGMMVLSVAHFLGMTGEGYVWIATDWLASVLDSSAPLDAETMATMQGVLALRHHTAESKGKSDFIHRWSKLTKKDVGREFRLNSYGLYAYDTVWLIAHAMDAFFNDSGVISFSSDSMLNDEKTGMLLLKSPIIFDGGNLMVSKIKESSFLGITGKIQFDSQGYLIHPAYDILNVIGAGLRTVGYWSNYSGLSVEPPELLYVRPANRSSASQHLLDVIWPGGTTMKPRGWTFPINRKDLRIGVPNRFSYREFASKVQGGNTMEGFCIDVFTAAIKLLPYAVSYKLVPFGDDRQNPNYTDLVNKVALNEFDAAVGDIAIVTSRTKIVDFTQPYIGCGLVILAPVRRYSSSTWAFLQPFTIKMWCVTGLFFLVVGAVVWILEHRINNEFRGPPRRHLVTIFWLGFSTFFFAHKENIIGTLGRAVLIVWLFVVLIIQSSYKASLSSILTVQQLSSPIKGIRSLIASNEPIGVQVGSFTENYLVEELCIAKSRIKPLGSPEDYARALELGPNNGGVAAVVDERPYIDLFLSKQCKFAIVGSEFTRSGWGFAFPRDSPLTDDMSNAILTLSENGDLQKLHDKWLARTVCSSEDKELDSDQLRLKSYLGLFLICGIACFLCLLVYFFLILRQYNQHYTSDQPDSSNEGSSQSASSFHRFISFVDEKEEDVKNRSKRRQMQKEINTGNGIEN